MSYLTETKRHISLSQLGYSAEEQVLTVGDRTLPLEPAWVEQNSPWWLVNSDGPNQLDSSMVCLNPHIKPIGTPRFHEWLASIKDDKEVRLSTIRVMHAVITRLAPEFEIGDLEGSGSFGFSMTITEHNHANLLTAGFCACLHQNPEGFWVDSGDWSEGYCEYDWHNIDSEAQAWSLLAGMGHLATLAAQESAK